MFNFIKRFIFRKEIKKIENLIKSLLEYNDRTKIKDIKESNVDYSDFLYNLFATSHYHHLLGKNTNLKVSRLSKGFYGCNIGKMFIPFYIDNYEEVYSVLNGDDFSKRSN